MEGNRASAAAFAAFTLVSVALAVATPSAAGYTKTVDEERTIHEGNHTWVLLYFTNPPSDLEIDLDWNSTVPVDVWLMNRAQWDSFDAGLSYTWNATQKGTNGTFRASIPVSLQQTGSWYIAIENGPRGTVNPPNDSVDDVAVFRLKGRMWEPDPVFTPDPGGLLFLRVIEVAFFLVPVLFVVFLVVRRLRRKDRQEKIRQELAAGNVVGGRAVVAPETVRPEPLPPPPPPAPVYAPQPYGQPTYYAPPQPAAFCGGCGAPRTSASGFCGHCGARL